MKPPKRVKVGPHPYRVILVEPGVLDAAGRLGQTIHASLEIHLETGQAPLQLADTLLHEVLHGVLAPYSMNSEKEEDFIRFLTPALLALLRDNPKLVRYLTEQR